MLVGVKRYGCFLIIDSILKVGVAHLQGQTDSHPCLFMWCMCITHLHLSLNAMLRLRMPC